MVKVIVIGDPHFKTNDYDECEEMAQEILNKTAIMKPDFIVVLGDTLDRFESIHVSPLSQATSFLQKLTEISYVYLLIGNHDRPNPKKFKPYEHPFNSLKLWNNMRVIDEAFVECIQEHYFIFCPYYFNGTFSENVNHLVHDNISAIFSHQEFRGVNMEGMISSSNDVVIPQYNIVINGHIHEYQEKHNLICVGTPRQIKFNESFPKSISLFEFSKKEWKHQRLYLELTEKITLKLNIDEYIKYIPPKKSKVKIIVEGTFDEIKNLMKKHKSNYENVKVSYHTLVEEKNKLYEINFKKSFKEHLYDIIKNSELEECYNEIFKIE
jgi:adenylate kinase family enzyme